MKRQEHPALDKIILLMVSGMTREDLQAAAGKLEIAPAEIENVIRAARRKINKAAKINQAQAIGTALARLNDIYSRALKANDGRTALQAVKELNKLQDLYRPQKPNPDAAAGNDSTAAAELAKIREHLQPLALAAADYPLHELARLAAEIVRIHQGEHDGR